MTQKEIAKILNISRSTVSLALSGSPKIKPETSRRIHEFAKKTNYQPDMTARSLVTQKTNLIGVLLPSFANRFFGELSDKIFNCLSEKGYSAIFGVGIDKERHSTLIDSMVSRKVDGIISYSADYEKLIRLSENGIPVVVYRRPGTYPLSYVDVDRYEGGRLLTQHLIETGRRRIAFVGGVNIQDKRFEGYQAAMFENDLEIDKSLIVNIYGELKEGIEGMRSLLEQSKGDLPDAVMFHNDSMAIGGMGEAMRSGIKVPGTMAITGFDDIEEAKYCVPSLTTISQPQKEIAEKLVKMLIEQIESKNSNHILKKHVFEPELILRESSQAGNKFKQTKVKEVLPNMDFVQV